MSWLYSQALVEEYSEVKCLDGAPCALWSGKPTRQASWLPAKTTKRSQLSQSGMTFKPLTDDLGGDVLTSFLEDFPVKTSVAPEKVQESKESDLPCGRTWRESLEKFDLDTHTWRTHQCLWDEDLQPSSVILPKWGMMLSGVLWERTTLPPLTSATESGSWATPTTMDKLPPKSKKALLKEATEARPGRSKPANLRDQVSNMRNWLTPSANEDAAGTPDGKMQSMLGNDPRVRGKTKEDWAKGTLNPAWVEWLMGWAIGWTSMEPITELDWRDWSVDPADVGEVPRVATGIKNRVGRLKAIGNGQVPQVAAMAWKILTKDN